MKGRGAEVFGMSLQESTGQLRLPVSLSRQDRRKSYRIDPKFQNRYRLHIMKFACLITVMAALLSLGVAHGLRHPGAYPDSIWVPVSFAAVAFLCGIFVIYLCDRISHRYCGPLIRIVRTLEAVQLGERPPPLKLRERDELRGLAEALNTTLQEHGLMEPPAG
jgi:hypothetical protein